MELHLSCTNPSIYGLVYQKQESGTWISNHLSKILCAVISYPYLTCLAHKALCMHTYFPYCFQFWLSIVTFTVSIDNNKHDDKRQYTIKHRQKPASMSHRTWIIYVYYFEHEGLLCPPWLNSILMIIIIDDLICVSYHLSMLKLCRCFGEGKLMLERSPMQVNFCAGQVKQLAWANGILHRTYKGHVFR